MVNRDGYPDCIVLVEPFVRLHALENQLLEVVKNADLHWMEEVGLREVAHNIGNMSKRVESSVDMARRESSIGCLRVGIAEHSI